MTTIKEVAKLAGTSVSTASSALNGKYGVSPSTRERVLEAARELHYVPNPIAQGLVTKATKNVSVILSTPSSFGLFTNPVFFEMVRAVTATLNKGSYNAVLTVVTAKDEAETVPRIARSRLTDALMLVGTRRSDRELGELLEKIEIPSVVMDRDAPSPKTLSVSVDSQACGYMATRHLLEMGHTSIGYVGSLPGFSLAEKRLSGYRQALCEWSVNYEEALVAVGDFYQESGYAATREFFGRSSPRPTAIFAANDLMAMGALEAIEQEGLRVPDDVSIVGCDDIPNLHLLRVPLSTVSVPYTEVGELAAKKIIGALEERDGSAPQSVLSPRFVARDSVSPQQYTKL